MIKLIEGYVLDSDKYQYLLHKPVVRVAKTGEDAGKEYVDYIDETYHSTVPQAIEALVRKLLRKRIAESDMNLQEVIDTFRDIEGEIRAAFKSAPEPLAPLPFTPEPDNQGTEDNPDAGSELQATSDFPDVRTRQDGKSDIGGSKHPPGSR